MTAEHTTNSRIIHLTALLAITCMLLTGCSKNGRHNNTSAKTSLPQPVMPPPLTTPADHNPSDPASSTHASLSPNDQNQTPDMPMAIHPTNMVVTVGSKVVYGNVFNSIVNRRIQSALAGRQPPSQDQLPSIIKQHRLQVLQDFVASNLLLLEADRLNISATDDEISAELASLTPAGMTDKQLIQQLGKPMESIRKDIEDQVIIRKVLEQKLEVSLQPTETEIKELYETAPGLELPERAHAKHILIKIPEDATPMEKTAFRQKLLEIKSRIDAGELDFESAAKEYSDHVSAPSGGDLGVFPRGKEPVSFTDKIFELKKDEVSDIIESQMGYHLIKLVDKFPAGKESYEKVRALLFNNLTQKKKIQFNDKIFAYVDDLARKTPITFGTELVLPIGKESAANTEGISTNQTSVENGEDDKVDHDQAAEVGTER